MILLTDYLFPSKYAKWRIEGTKALIDAGADILVSKLEGYAGVVYDVDYVEMMDYFQLNKFNILIFDAKYNWLNQYNSVVDGTKYNNKIPGYSYVFTKHQEFDINNYSKVFHIFLSGYVNFNKHFSFDNSNQFIHLYPGGGYSDKNALKSIPKEVNIISTQHFCSNQLRSLGHTNFIEAFGSTVLPQSPIIAPKPINNSTIRVCFSNMGSAAQKGFKFYSNVVDKYKSTYPNDDIQFIFIGNNTEPTNNKITYIDKMSQHELDTLYNTNIDILINSENGTALNGWPLGVEAAIQGVVLITTDTHKCNSTFKYNENMLFIINNNDIIKCVSYLNKLYNDRQLLNSMSCAIQSHTHDKFNYKIQQQKILDYIKSPRLINAGGIYRQICPYFITEDYFFSIDDKFAFTDHHFMSSNTRVLDHIKYCIESRSKLSLVRYNDGEWISALRITDNNLYNIHRVKWGIEGQKFVDQNLIPIIKNLPDYNIGISSEVLKKPYMMKHITPYLKNKKLFDGGIFARWSITGELNYLLDFIRSSDVPTILVGPEYLSTLANMYGFHHIITPNDVWTAYDKINEKLNSSLINKYSIVLYCCSFVAKKLIDNNKNSDICQLDIGAAFDGLCNKQTRPWH